MSFVHLVRSSFVVLGATLALGASGRLSAAGPGEEIRLFDGKDLKGWRTPTADWLVAHAVKPDPANPKVFAIEAGQDVLVNGPNGRTSNLVSIHEHGDVQAHVEFCVPKDSNSGVYFMGRYEVQVFDSWGVKEPKYSDCGGIYERWKDDKGYEGHAPRVNASRAPASGRALM